MAVILGCSGMFDAVGKLGYLLPEKVRNLLASAMTSDEMVIRSGLLPSLWSFDPWPLSALRR